MQSKFKHLNYQGNYNYKSQAMYELNGKVKRQEE